MYIPRYVSYQEYEFLMPDGSGRNVGEDTDGKIQKFTPPGNSSRRLHLLCGLSLSAELSLISL